MPAVNFDAIPADLRSLDRWVVWKAVPRDGRMTKMPRAPANPTRPASSTDPATWGTFDQARSAYEESAGNLDGIGFVFNGDGIIGLDWDHVLNLETGEWTPAALEQITSLGSYAELSPSGTGAHVICRGAIPGNRNRSGGIEIYESARFFTVTGNRLDGTPTTVEASPAETLTAIYQAMISQAADTGRDTQRKNNEILSGYVEGRPTDKTALEHQENGRIAHELTDDEIVKRCKRVKNAEVFDRLMQGDTSAHNGDDSAADLALCNLIAFWTRDPYQVDRIFRRSALCRQKWDEKRGDRGSYGWMTVEKAISDTPLYNPNYSAGKSSTGVRGTRTSLPVDDTTAPAEPEINPNDLMVECAILEDKTAPKITGDARSPALSLIVRREILFGRGDINGRKKSALKTAISFNKDRCDPPYQSLPLSNIVKAALVGAEEVYERWADRRRDEKATASAADTDPEITPDIETEAIEILRTGDPFKYICDTFGTIHCGDREIAQVIAIASGAQSCITTQGIQPALGGRKGAGKTAAAKAMVHLHPREYALTTTFSAKALFYHDIKPGTILLSDDVEFEPEINATIKRAMSDFQNETEHVTLDKNLNPIRRKLARRMMFLLTSIGDQGDEQLTDRQYKLSITPDPNADARYDAFLKALQKDGLPQYPISREVLICRAMFREIKRREFAVIVPYADYITFNDRGNRRILNNFYDFVHGVTAIRFMQREQRTDPTNPEGPIRLISTVDDLMFAIGVYQTNEDTRKYGLSRDERVLWQWIWENGSDRTDGNGREIYETVIYSEYGRTAAKRSKDGTRTAIRRLLFGRPDQRSSTGGLLGKVPGCFNIEATSEEIGDGGTRRVRKNLITVSSPPTLLDTNGFLLFDHKGWEKEAQNGPESGK